MKPKKKPSLSKIKKKAWATFSTYIRLRDWDAQGRQYLEDKKATNCFTCGKFYPVEGVGCMQAGHFIAGRNNQVLYDDRQVHAQCYHCNHHLKGNHAIYYLKMLKKYDQNTVNQMMEDHNLTKKYTIPELEEMIEAWKSQISDLISNTGEVK